VWLPLLTIAAAVLVVVVTFGSFSQLSKVPISAGWLLAGGLALQVGLEIVDVPKDKIETVGYGLLMVSYALLLAFCLTNLRVAGFGVIAVGIAMNTLVIGLNRGMPTIDIGNDARGRRVEKPVPVSVKHRPERPNDLLRFLDDRIVLPEPFDAVVSFGDLVVGVGVCEFAYFASRRRRRRGVGDQAEVSNPRRTRTRSRAPSTRPS
jgi:uncharacterized protein DUF5317